LIHRQRVEHNTCIFRNCYYLGVQSSQDVRVTGVSDGHDGDTIEATTGGTELVVAASEVVDTSLGQQSVVLDLRLAQRRAVSGDKDELGLSLSDSLHSGLPAKSVLTGLDHQLKLAVDRFDSLRLLGRHDLT
jgi:hypothetical protein